VQVLEIKDNVDKTRLSNTPAQKPRGGDVYLYVYGESTTRGESKFSTWWFDRFKYSLCDNNHWL